MNSAITTLLNEIRFNSDGLVPVITQSMNGEILMLAWMNKEAITETLNTKQMCYFSRSRQSLWKKGERSGQIQQLKELLLDCDGDTLLAKVEQTGVACHTGRKTCFFRTVTDQGLTINQDVIISPNELYPHS